MDKYIPYEKLSKKEKRRLNAAKRNTWGNLNSVTRKPENSKAYNRKKMQNWKKELPNSASSFHFLQRSNISRSINLQTGYVDDTQFRIRLAYKLN